MQHGPNKVFGIGLSRTGTTSLTKALQRLGFKTIHYPHDATTHRELARAEYRLSILEQFDAVTDITVSPYYAQLDSVYPGSKFILTVRDLDSWLRSLREHFLRLSEYVEENPQFRSFTHFICAVVYGSHQFHEDRMAFAYENHVRNVHTYFDDRPEDLLQLDICAGQGWQEICRFLGRDVPKTSFPHKNRG